MPGAIRFAIAVALLSHFCFLILWLGWARWWTFLPAFAATIVLAARKTRPALPDRRWLALSPFLILYAIHTLAPDYQPDAITYHLGNPVEWIRAGGFVPRAGFFDVIPHGLEVLFAGAYSFGGFTAAKLVHFAFLPATVSLMAATARRLGFDGWPAAVLFAVTPVAAITASSAYNDTAAAFYTLAAFYLLWTGLEDGANPRTLAVAGWAAGFCYAIKMSGAVVPLALVLTLLVRRRPRAALVAAAAAAFAIAPWMLRAWLWTGNPVAPMAYSWIPTPHFTAAALDSWNEYVRWYGVPWTQRWWEITFGGARANGLIGPVYLLAPLGLAALRRRAGRLLWLAAAVAALPWLLNAGTRFLMPALPFVALALVLALPSRIAWALAAAHAILSWPHVLDRYTPPGSWHLSGVPWRAALRLEDPAVYLRRSSFAYRVAELVNRHTRPGDRVLDFIEAPRAYTHATMLVSWQHASARRASDALNIGVSHARTVFYELHGDWPAQPLAAIVFEQFSTSPDGWSIQEAKLLRGGEAIFPSQSWQLDAWPNPWDAPLAFDRNPVSRWHTWQPRRDGMYLRIDFPQPVTIDAARLLCLRNEAGPRVRVRGVTASGADVVLYAHMPAREPVALNRRADAVRYVRREGFQWILTATGDEGLDLVGRDLVNFSRDWEMEIAGREGGAYLLRINGKR